MALLQVEDLSKRYGSVLANDHVSLSVDSGEVFGLLGPNGAGKSTLVRQIIGLVRPTAGGMRLGGVDIVADPRFAKRHCSFQPQAPVAIAGLTARQAISLAGRLRGNDRSTVATAASELLERLSLEPWADRPLAQASGGVGRLVMFCMAVVSPGRLVILDEPTNDVDPLRRKVLWELVGELASAGVAVLLVTHNVLEAERAVHRLAVMDRGRVVATGSPAQLKGPDRGLRLEVTLEADVGAPPQPAFASDLAVSGRRISLQLPADTAQAALAWCAQLQEQGIAEEYGLGPTSLEDVYVTLVSQGEES